MSQPFDHPAYNKSRYESRKAAGLCPACGDNPKSIESIYCLACLDKQRARQKTTAEQVAQARIEQHAQQQAVWDEAGRCVDCGGERVSKFRCRKCWSLYLIKEKGWTRHDARKRAGLCASCDNPTAGVRCETCQRKRRDQHAARKAKQLCTICGKRKARSEKTTCEQCATEKVKLYAERKATGQCPHCGSDKPLAPGKHCLRCQTINRKKNRKRYQKLRAQVLAAYGGACKCCGETTVEFLQIDHVNNDGAAHRKQLGGAGSFRLYNWLRKHGFPKEGFQLLCANCNFAKGHYGRCPHEK